MESKKVTKLVNKRIRQIVVWNLSRFEQRLIDKKESVDAYTIRQALDLLSPNWREVKEFREIKLYGE
jgi:hypothetical protein